MLSSVTSTATAAAAAAAAITATATAFAFLPWSTFFREQEPRRTSSNSYVLPHPLLLLLLPSMLVKNSSSILHTHIHSFFTLTHTHPCHAHSAPHPLTHSIPPIRLLSRNVNVTYPPPAFLRLGSYGPLFVLSKKATNNRARVAAQTSTRHTRTNLDFTMHNSRGNIPLSRSRDLPYSRADIRSAVAVSGILLQSVPQPACLFHALVPSCVPRLTY